MGEIVLICKIRCAVSRECQSDPSKSNRIIECSYLTSIVSRGRRRRHLVVALVPGILLPRQPPGQRRGVVAHGLQQSMRMRLMVVVRKIQKVRWRISFAPSCVSCAENSRERTHLTNYRENYPLFSSTNRQPSTMKTQTACRCYRDWLYSY